MPIQKGYRDACGTALGLDIVGERWALLVVRELLAGPRRFSDLRRELPLASPNALSSRLSELTETGVLCQRAIEPPGHGQVYELTEWGHDLEPVLVALGDWALRSGRTDPAAQLSLGSVMLTIRTYWAGAEQGVIALRVLDRAGCQNVQLCLRDGRASTCHGSPDSPDAVITGSAHAIIASLGTGSVADIDVAGNTDLVEAFWGGFVMPTSPQISSPQISSPRISSLERQQPHPQDHGIDGPSELARINVETVRRSGFADAGRPP